MQYNKVPRIKEALSAIGVGCWNFGGDWDESDDHNSETIVLTAVENGINLFDVAPVYGFSHAETVLGKILAEHKLRNKVLIATKCGLRWNKDRQTRNDLSRESILWEIDQSLNRLRTDHIDIYQLHWPDPSTPIEETADTLKGLITCGKIRYVGLSNYSARDAAVFEQYLPIQTQQGLYNMLERNADQYHHIPLAYRTEKEIFPYVKEHGQAFFPYSALFQGLLAGGFGMDRSFSDRDIRNANPKFHGETYQLYHSAAVRLQGFADSIGKPMNEVAFNWLRQIPEVTCIITGAGSGGQLEANLRCLGWSLTDDMMREIETIIHPFKNL